MVSITCFDGVNCIGGNKILLEDGSARLLFDFGKNFGKEGDFYEELLQPKTLSGIYEQILLGILPPFCDLYRQDLIWGDCDPWDQVAPKQIGHVDGLLVSHAHVDHIGAIHYLRPDIPIHCSPMTAAVSKALQEAGRSATGAEYCYYVERTCNETGVCTPNYRSSVSINRDYCLTQQPTPEFEAFWGSSAGSRELAPTACRTSDRCGSLPIRSYPVDHSVYGATAWAVETSAGWVVYSGDIRLHGGNGYMTRRFAEEVAKLNPVAMLIEGTRINSESKRTEPEVRDACLEVVRSAEGLVVADFGPRNVERLLIFLEVAKETGRELVILPSDAYLLNAMRSADPQAVPDIRASGIRIYRKYQSKPLKWASEILDEYADLVVGPSDVSANQDKFICCFSYFDVGELAYILPKPGSVWAYSSCEAFNEEMQFDQDRLKRWLDHFGVRLVGGDEGSPLHVSGHASGPDLAWVVQTIRPKTIIPIHSEKPQAYEDRVGDICKIVYPEVGKAIGL